MRTFGGSNNSNWRSPQKFDENTVANRSSFPDMNFFRTTPPPQRSTPPPAVSSPPVVDSLQQTSFKSSNQTHMEALQLASTPLNPYRSTKRQIVFPRTPNLLKPTSSQNPTSEYAMSTLPITASTTAPSSTTASNIESISLAQESSETRIHLTPEDQEALKQLLLVYK